MITPAQKTGTRLLSLQEGRALLALYESMLEMARARDWERLAEIERQAAAIRDAASARSQGPAETGPPEAGEIKALAELLIRIQILDREIRGYIEPAREQARQQLTAEVKSRAVRAAYGDGADAPG
ncbi:MAG: flagellar protein FliT [Azoarcus sp.]|jgi:hypothetical protein|nr:flagellar protein FliT [Azoarcus sp.]